MSVISVRVSERGKITLPPTIRRKLNLKKGDRIFFVETEQGVLITPAAEVVAEALKDIGETLKAKGLTLDEMVERGRVIREKIIAEEYGLTDQQP
jgi:AbrB family looped-hinge helix DNA binding protein